MEGINFDLDIKEYHAQRDMEVHYVSSSQLKTMLEDPELFYRTYVTKEVEKETTSAMDIGSYFHTSILEPHKVDEEFAFYSGAVRRGKAWDDLVANSNGKIILTSSDKEKGDTLIEGVKKSPVAMSLLHGGRPEVSCGVKLLVCPKRELILSTKRDSYLYPDMDGWKYYADTKELDISDMLEIRVKVRADYLHPNWILDLKSTSSKAKNVRDIVRAIEMYQYDMSAALYLDMFNIYLENPVNDFYWVFAQKDVSNSKTWLASKDSIRVGRAKWRKAIIDLASCISQNWTFRDELGVVEPSYWDKEWIKVKEVDVTKLL